MKALIGNIKPVLNAYAVLFFSQHAVFGLLLLVVSMLNVAAGLCGLAGVIFSLLAANALGFDKTTIRMGIYSFNNLLLGLAFGTFYHVNPQFFLWYAVASLMVLVVTGILTQRLGHMGLPILSLPFIITFWIVLLAANSVFNTGLLQKSSYLLQEIYNGQNHIDNLHQYLCDNMPGWLCLYLRALSAVVFQSNVICGLVIMIGLLIHSRIAFSLSIIGFATAMLFNTVFHIYPDGISYYHLGANFMMANVAIGSFFIIPSWRSFLWAIISVPIVFILVNAFTSLLGLHFLPVFSLPFCLINFTFLYFLQMRKHAGRLQLAVVQHYSPERNLYQFTNQRERLNDLKYFGFSLPFMGQWTVSQGYKGKITHLGDWGQALDFAITDDDGNTYKYPGTEPAHFYSYNKPILACGDGWVEAVVTHVEDNAIGDINTIENWGNTVVIKHLDGLYSKVSHLKKDSVLVVPGQFVKAGDTLGLCGNSGRSPEPHLHFQLQATPYIGSKTLAYPFAAYEVKAHNNTVFKSFNIPQEGEIINTLPVNNAIKKAFDFQPGYIARLSAGGKTETIESNKNELNQSYLYSHDTGSTAYFINNGTQFYFTSFYGDRSSLLYQFYLAAYNILFSEGVAAHDSFPVQALGNKPMLWLQDFAAPFIQFINIGYRSEASANLNGIIIHSERIEKGAATMQSDIYINGNVLQRFENTSTNFKIDIEWLTGNM